MALGYIYFIIILWEEHSLYKNTERYEGSARRR